MRACVTSFSLHALTLVTRSYARLCNIIFIMAYSGESSNVTHHCMVSEEGIPQLQVCRMLLRLDPYLRLSVSQSQWTVHISASKQLSGDRFVFTLHY